MKKQAKYAVNENGLTPREQEHEEKRELLMKDFDTDPRPVPRLKILKQVLEATWKFIEETPMNKKHAFILGGFLQTCNFILDHILADLEPYDLSEDGTAVKEYVQDLEKQREKE